MCEIEGEAEKQMESKKGQKYINVAYKWPCMGSSINDIQSPNGGILFKIKKAS